MKSYNFFLICVLLLSACGTFPGSGGGETKIADSYKKICQSSAGVTIEMLNQLDYADADSYEENIITISNTGCSRTKGFLILSVDPSEMVFMPDRTDIIAHPFSLEERTQMVPHERKDELYFNLYIKPLLENEENDVHNLLISTCYNYETQASATVCVNQDPNNIFDVPEDCEIQNTLPFTTEKKGPLSISRIEYKPTADPTSAKLQFKFHIQNNNRGKVTIPTVTRDICMGRSLPNEEGAVKLSDLRLGQFTINDFDCKNNPLDFKHDVPEENIITCTLKSGLLEKAPITRYEPLIAEISYGYVDIGSQPINIG